MKLAIIFGGKAGQGPNILTEIVSQGLIEKGYHVFYSRDYESLIRGGHNFNTLTFSDEKVLSNTSKADILVCLDENTEKVHTRDMNKNAIIVKMQEGKGNMFFAGAVFRILGLEFDILENKLKKLKKFEENLKDAKEGYQAEKRKLEIKASKSKLNEDMFMNGNQATSKSAIQSGLEYYYAYPMTPATPLMMELGQMQLDKNAKHKVIEMENEISVIMAGLGSSLVGGISMVGTSGGGFDLMTEALSLSGMAEIPIVAYLASRPGPSTGVATYSSQADLNLALYSCHGEFSRIVLSPGDIEESMTTTNTAFQLSQKFRLPAIILTDKHLAEAKSLAESIPKIKEVKTTIKIGERFNSYEHDHSKDNIATEDSEVIKANFEERAKLQKELEKFSENDFEMFKIHGKKDSKNLILGWGSTKGAILDAIKDKNIDAKFLQVIFLEPFSEKIQAELKKAKKVVIVENNATSQLSQLISHKTGFIIEDKNKILRYDGRPFFSDELAEEIERRLK